MRLNRTHLINTFVAVVLASFVGVVAYQFYLRSPRSWPSDVGQVFTAESAAVVAQLDSFHVRNGRYPSPAEFEAMAVPKPTIGMKEWVYVSDGATFQLKVVASPVKYPSIWFESVNREIHIDG
jgi:hypothetical protein